MECNWKKNALKNLKFSLPLNLIRIEERSFWKMSPHMYIEAPYCGCEWRAVAGGSSRCREGEDLCFLPVISSVDDLSSEAFFKVFAAHFHVFSRMFLPFMKAEFSKFSLWLGVPRLIFFSIGCRRLSFSQGRKKKEGEEESERPINFHLCRLHLSFSIQKNFFQKKWVR
mgnify:CR=1 FL=1